MCVVCACQQKLEELKRAQEEELEDRLDAGVKRILAANRRLAEELRLHVTVRVMHQPCGRDEGEVGRTAVFKSGRGLLCGSRQCRIVQHAVSQPDDFAIVCCVCMYVSLCAGV